MFARLLVCCLVCLLADASSAHAEVADPARSASARTLFEEGLRKADALAWSEAADLFERALALRDSAVIRFNLSSALIELGRLVEASEQLRTLEIDQRATPELRESATRGRETLLPRLAKLTIRIDGHDPSLLVLLDDRKVAPEQLGVAIPVDPTAHHIVLRSGERLLDDDHVALGEGQAADVRLVGIVALPVAAAPSTPRVFMPAQREHDDSSTLGSTRQDELDEAGRKRRRRLLWGLGGTAVAVAAGVVTGVLLASGKSHGGGPADPFSPGSVGVRVPQ
ncbi:MAG: hypothetical protein JWN48_3200 [Myxococcaceae bacterium]|nr:hypothetical protein [Myxococcaceae bacterium]